MELILGVSNTSLENNEPNRDMREVVIGHRWEIAEGIIALSLAGDDLPSWEPGAHIDISLPGIGIRSYSLIGDGLDTNNYQIAVLIKESDAGGAKFIEENFKPGYKVSIYPPKNSFPLVKADEYIFFAGGIGVTPFISMVEALNQRGMKWTFHYFGHDRARMAFIDELEKLASTSSSRLFLHVSSETGHQNLADLLEDDVRNAAIYSCGPGSFMDELALIASGKRDISFHMERFGRMIPTDDGQAMPAPSSSDKGTDVPCDPDGSFTVELRKSGQTITVPPDKSILDCALTVDKNLPYSCCEGFCGTCETNVLGGSPDHRDRLLTDEEREKSCTMMICVSRSKTQKLILDI